MGKVFSSEAEARQQVSPDKPQLLIVNRKRICLVLHKEKFYGVQDACSHNGMSLSKGQINYLGEVICPLHGYQFDLQTGRCNAGARDLVTFPVKIDETGFFVGV